MSARSCWKGFFHLGLINFPVKAYNAVAGESGEIKMNQLHLQCKARINYKKICSACKKEVPNEDIVSGYEFAKDSYVTIKPDEIEALNPENDKAINVTEFISIEAVDPIYFDGKAHFLLPDGPVGALAYHLVWDGLKKTKRAAIATSVRFGRKQLLLIRPMGRLLGYHFLKFDNEVNKLAGFEEELTEVQVSSEEAALMENLVNAKTKKKFDYGIYEDDYTAQLTKLIQAKQEGKEIVVVATPKASAPASLMDALRASVEKAKEKADNGQAKPKAAPKKKK